jgi:chemotaxis protein MotA
VLQGFAVPIVALAAFATGAFIWPEFFDPTSLLLTLGGSAFVTWISYPNRQLGGLLLDLRALFTETQTRLQTHADELARLTRLYRLDGLRGLESQEGHLADPFLQWGVGMLVDLQKEETIRARLEREFAGVVSRNESSHQILLTLGKLLPAFGLIGTLIGMVLLLRGFTGQEGQALTTALSLAVLTTLYGAVLANVLVAPLAARLHAVSTEKEMKMNLTAEWVVTIARGEAAASVAAKPGGFIHAADMQGHRGRDLAQYAFVQHR